MATKERITPPSPANVREAAKELPKGGPARGPDGRVLTEQKIAQRQHVKRSK
jgi:hypothetical protein